MAKIQERLDMLQPYVIGIRYVEGVAFIDAILKEGWSVPKSNVISKHVDEQQPTYHLFYSEKEGIGIDELLDYVEKIINLNIERQLKQDFLKVKVDELKALFVKTPLIELKTLKFVLGKNNLIPDLTDGEDDLDISIDDPINDSIDEKNGEQPIHQEPIPQEQINQQPINHEVKINNKIRPNQSQQKNGIELPPKGKIELEIHDLPPEMTQGPCNCGPDEFCPKCMDEKGM